MTKFTIEDAQKAIDFLFKHYMYAPLITWAMIIVLVWIAGLDLPKSDITDGQKNLVWLIAWFSVGTTSVIVNGLDKLRNEND